MALDLVESRRMMERYWECPTCVTKYYAPRAREVIEPFCVRGTGRHDICIRCIVGSGAANIDITVVLILAAHVISNIRSFDFTYVESILHGTKNHVISNIRVTLILCGRPDSCRRAV